MCCRGGQKMNGHAGRLGNERIDKLLFKLSAPAMVGMLVQALYNVVDTIFVGRSVGFMGIAGLTIVFPIHLIIIAFIQIVGIGGASIISRSLGAGDIDRAEKTLGNMISLVLIISLFITVFGSIYIEPILRLFGATQTILPYSKEYLRIILFGTLFFTYAMASNNVVRSEGNAKVALYTMLISAGLNIILDPIFIFVFNMGIQGAAIATVISQAVTAVYLLFYFFNKKSTLRIKIENLRLNYEVVKETFAIGVSAFARQVSGSIMAIIVNNTLGVYGGDITIAAFGVISRLLMFIYMPMFGIVQGLLPIVGFNYGARKLDRVKKAIQLSFLAATTMAFIAFLLFMLIPETLFRIFSEDQELINIGVKALRILGLALPVVGFQIVGASIFQAVGKALPALILSLSRQLLFLIPLLIILPLFFQLTGVWAAFPIADILSFLVTLIAVLKVMRSFTEEIIVLPKNFETKAE
jgi:putative MATE family efflux protein